MGQAKEAEGCAVAGKRLRGAPMPERRASLPVKEDEGAHSHKAEESSRSRAPTGATSCAQTMAARMWRFAQPAPCEACMLGPVGWQGSSTHTWVNACSEHGRAGGIDTRACPAAPESPTGHTACSGACWERLGEPFMQCG